MAPIRIRMYRRLFRHTINLVRYGYAVAFTTSLNAWAATLPAASSVSGGWGPRHRVGGTQPSGAHAQGTT